MGCISNAAAVRADVFRASGKWYASISLDMREFYYRGPSCPTAVMEAFKFKYGGLYAGMTIVVTDPYHQFPCPVLFVAEG